MPHAQLIHLSSIFLETLKIPSFQPVHVRHRSPPRHTRRRKQGTNGPSPDPDLQEVVQKTSVKEDKDVKVCESYERNTHVSLHSWTLCNGRVFVNIWVLPATTVLTVNCHSGPSYKTFLFLLFFSNLFIYLWFPWDYPVNEEIPNST